MKDLKVTKNILFGILIIFTTHSYNNNQNIEEIVFIIAGSSGSLTTHVEEKAKESKGRVISRINVPYDLLPDYYQASDLMIAPTVGNHACMGVSVKEAMSSSLASVVSDSGGLPEAIRDGIDGIVVPSLKDASIDTELFSEHINRLIFDNNLKGKYGLNARKRAIEVFSNQATLKKYKSLFTYN